MLEKLKKVLNRELSAKLGKDILKQYGFIPVNLQNDILFVACINHNPQTDEKVRSYFNSQVKYIPLPQDQFAQLLEFTFEGQPANDATPAQPQPTKPSAGMSKSAQSTSNTAPVKRIGDILLEKGFVTQEDLEKAFAQSKERHEPIGSTLVKMNILTTAQLKEALSEQKGIDAVTEKQLHFSDTLVKLFPREFLEENKLVPISSDGKTIVIGMVNPTDKKVLNDIVFLTGLKPDPRLLTFYEYDRSVKAFFKETDRKAKLFEHISAENQVVIEETLSQKVERDIKNDESSISKFTNQIVTDAIDIKASDIHIEPRFNNYIVRYRIDGILRKIVEIPTNIESSIISRFKVLAKMNIAEHRRAQDGAFSIKHKVKMYDCRINTIPVGSKEKMVIRILQPSVNLSGENKAIQLVGAYEEDIQKLERMIKIPYGIILAAGPTGSGKTTTLYSILNNLNNEDVNITTIEDPVEIRLEGVNQIQVNPKADITFANCLRAILRQDPDIILVGEIRDFETLEAAIAAALTGHLVLSTVHTNSAAATISRLMQMGAPNYLIASSLSGVIAQRLVRRLCPYCKTKYQPTEEELKQILLNPEDIKEFKEKELYKPVGCPQCQYTGYLGRLGLFELMPVNKEIKKLISQSESDITIEEVAISCGMKTLQQYCLEHIINGETPVSEFIRVLGVVSD